MPSLMRGKKLFENLIEYPLPRRTGVRDYIFYLVPKDDEKMYGITARSFFHKYYKNHATHEVSSLEEIIEVLYSDVTQGGVQQIRETIIVTHANSRALIFPVITTGTEANRKKFKYVTDISFVRLQKAFLQGEFESFRKKRSKVITHFQNDSWVTIRGCNFGNSDNGLYALYSFFGGRANVYAPRMYQTFWKSPLIPGAFLETEEQAGRHEVMQHFPSRTNRNYTPQRKGIVGVDDSTLLGAVTELASINTAASDPDEEKQYQEIVETLNGKRQLEDLPGLPSFSSEARINQSGKNGPWFISDTLAHNEKRYRIKYHIYTRITDSPPDNKRKALWAQAQLAVNTTFPIQLFLDRVAHDKVSGVLFDLAAYADGESDPSNKARFDAVLVLLQSNRLSDAARNVVDIGEEFKHNLGVELVAKPKSSGQNQWVIDDKEQYLIRLEHSARPQGGPAHAITVYIGNVDVREANGRYLLPILGLHPNTPGTELAACLDRLTRDELVSLIDYLRAPFKEGHGFYIHHAQEALGRKRGSLKWVFDTFAEEKTLALPQRSYMYLGQVEGEDFAEKSYTSAFNRIWAEVKVSALDTLNVKNDLFEEEDLARKFRIQETELLDDLPEQEPDEIPLPTKEENGFTQSFATHPFMGEKRMIQIAEIESTANCQEFEAAFIKWREVRNLDIEEIRAVLEKERTHNGNSYFDVVLSVAKKYKFLEGLLKFGLGAKFPGWWPPVPTSTDGIAREVAKFYVKGVVSKELASWLSLEAMSLWRLVLFQTGLALLEAYSLILVPLTFAKQFGEEWQRAEASWENLGKLTAIRQWLRRVEDATYKASGIPDLHNIDISTPVSAMPYYSQLPFANEPYYIGRLFLEHYEETGRYELFNIFAPDRMKVGFDRGAAVMVGVAGELVNRARLGVSELLKREGLESCEVKVLVDVGLVDRGALEATIAGHLAEAIRNRLTKV